MTSFSIRLLPAIAVIFTATTAAAADSACKLMADANTKVYAIPTHIYQTEKAVYTGGKTRNSEVIYLNNKIYIMTGGKWILSKMTPPSMAAAQKDAREAEPGMTCTVVRDEVVNGEATTVYSAHRQTPEVKSDTQAWISKSRGVPVKIESDTDVGGSDGKSHRSLRYEYTNVQAPAGVQ